MRRREFVTLVAGVAAAWPLAARAGERRVIVIMNVAATDPEGQLNFDAIGEGLTGLGWKVGQDVTLEFRGIGGNLNLVEGYVADAVGAAPDLIVSSSGPILAALEKRTHSIPIVFLEVIDPVAGGFVKSMARPGDNVTGFTNFEPEIGGKWLELLKTIAPEVTRVIVVLNPDIRQQIYVLDAIKNFARDSNVAVISAGVHNEIDIKRALTGNASVKGTGVIVLPNPITIANRGMLVQTANAAGLPTICPNKYFAKEGGLISYGVDSPAQYRQAADYIDRILRGAKAGDLPNSGADQI